MPETAKPPGDPSGKPAPTMGGPTAGPTHPTAPSPTGESAKPGEAPADLNRTIPGGKYLAPDGKTFVNAQGEPIDEHGKRVEG